MCLADFESYYQTRQSMIGAYANKDAWNRMSLLNIAAAGKFAADRSIEEYADRIWGLRKVK
jgi:starch phosphorylase